MDAAPGPAAAANAAEARVLAESGGVTRVPPTNEETAVPESPDAAEAASGSPAKAGSLAAPASSRTTSAPGESTAGATMPPLLTVLWSVILRAEKFVVPCPVAGAATPVRPGPVEEFSSCPGTEERSRLFDSVGSRGVAAASGWETISPWSAPPAGPFRGVAVGESMAHSGASKVAAAVSCCSQVGEWSGGGESVADAAGAAGAAATARTTGAPGAIEFPGAATVEAAPGRAAAASGAEARVLAASMGVTKVPPTNEEAAVPESPGAAEAASGSPAKAGSLAAPASSPAAAAPGESTAGAVMPPLLTVLWSVILRAEKFVVPCPVAGAATPVRPGPVEGFPPCPGTEEKSRLFPDGRVNGRRPLESSGRAGPPCGAAAAVLPVAGEPTSPPAIGEPRTTVEPVSKSENNAASLGPLASAAPPGVASVVTRSWPSVAPVGEAGAAGESAAELGERDMFMPASIHGENPRHP